MPSLHKCLIVEFDMVANESTRQNKAFGITRVAISTRSPLSPLSRLVGQSCLHLVRFAEELLVLMMSCLTQNRRILHFRLYSFLRRCILLSIGPKFCQIANLAYTGRNQ